MFSLKFLEFSVPVSQAVGPRQVRFVNGLEILMELWGTWNQVAFRIVHLGLQFIFLYQASFHPGRRKRYKEVLCNLICSSCVLVTDSFLGNSEV